MTATKLIKFPTTPHLVWLGQKPLREDKLMAASQAEEFLRAPITVEEKVDGANIGFSTDHAGCLRVQNRGHFVTPETKGQFSNLWYWLSTRRNQLSDVLRDRLILFGEWCYARHSIHYTRLPDWFLAFDVFDKQEKRFINSYGRDEVVRQLGLSSVPKVASGLFTVPKLLSLLTRSSLYDGPMEGIYLRRESASWLLERAKIVRAEFVQEIGEHWSNRPLIPNQLSLEQTSRQTPTTEPKHR
ncbi:MAG: RNA ligase family protein [Candidatus Udaeobacter sp.]